MSSLVLLLFAFSLPAFAADGDAQAACCCVGVVVMILAAIGFNENRKKGAGSSGEQTGASQPPRPAASPYFQVMLERAEKDLGSGITDCLVVKMRGPVNLHPAQLTAVFSLSMLDVTSGSGKEDAKPILCSIPDLQLKDTQVFHWVYLHQMPYAQSVVNEWIELISIPVAALTFPARGMRKISVNLEISSLGIKDGPANSAAWIHDFENRSFGYVDGIRQRIKTEELGLKLAAAVSAVDGDLDEKEKAVIRGWMDSRIESLPENMRADTNRELSRALMVAERLGARIEPGEVNGMVEDLIEQHSVNTLPLGDRNDVVKLCMKVAAADGTAGPDELKLIDLISKLLQADEKTVEKDMGKLLPPSMHSKKDMDNMLGLDPSWTAKEKKKHLRGLYREWSSRVTHSDPQMREQAEGMLRLIADARAKLDAQE